MFSVARPTLELPSARGVEPLPTEPVKVPPPMFRVCVPALKELPVTSEE